MNNNLDILIKNARVIDGTANPYYKTDIGISQGEIARIARNINEEQADIVIHANGLTVSPGFIDTHSHDDLFVIFKPTADEKVRQGVTSVVVGNCGNSVAPKERNRSGVFGRALPEAIIGLVKGISTFNDYLEAVNKAKPGINVIPLVGHSAVRIYVLGIENRPPTQKELEKMQFSVAQAMEEGAFGLSTGLIYPPGNYAETDEIIALASVVGEYAGIYASHIRNEGDNLLPAMEEAIEIGEKAGVPVLISHHKAAGKPNWGKSKLSLKMMADARDRGVEISCDQYPYTAGSTFLGAILPPHHYSEGPKALSLKLGQKSFRDSLIKELEPDAKEGQEHLLRGAGLENIYISQTQKHREYLGRSLAEIALSEGKDSYDLLFDLLMEEPIDINMVLFMMGDEDIHRIMKNPFTMIGTDGTPSFGESKIHPRMSGTYPRVLGEYVRKKRILPLEEAIRKMTSLPAQTFGLKNKGLIKEGFDADLVIFDPDTIIDQATYEEPDLPPLGISHVLVNGRIAVENGKIMGATSGKVLRHQT